jgi:hypothetical protein
MSLLGRIYLLILRRYGPIQPIECFAKELLYDHYRFTSQFVYRDETWPRVQNRVEDRLSIFHGKGVASADTQATSDKLTLHDTYVRFESRGVPDDWIWIEVADKGLTDYVWQFDFVAFDKFREIQFAFRYQGFYDRYRFRLDGGLLHFDILYRGMFINSIVTRPFDVEIGRVYNFRIGALSNRYFLEIDNCVQMVVSDPASLYSSGGVAFIFWDATGSADLVGEVRNVAIHSISK